MENFRRQIFEQLGNLYYALAADQRVSPMESGELKMLLRKDWLADGELHSGEKVSEAAHLIGLTIDALQNENVPPEEAYGNFERFFSHHSEQFSKALAQKILETAEAIVKIFPGKGGRNAHLDDLLILFRQPEQTMGSPKKR